MKDKPYKRTSTALQLGHDINKGNRNPHRMKHEEEIILQGSAFEEVEAFT